MIILTKQEREIIVNALDTYVTLAKTMPGAPAKLGKKIVAQREAVLKKITENACVELVLGGRELPEDVQKDLREYVRTDDEHEVDDQFIVSLADDGLWVNGWTWLGAAELSKELRNKIWPGVRFADDNEE